MKFKIVPWRDSAEFISVYQQLFPHGDDGKVITRERLSNHSRDIRKGLRRLHIWQLRGRIPLAVQSTHDILSALLNAISSERCAGSKSTSRDGSDSSNYAQRMLYSMTIIRFLNGLSDQNQNQRYVTSIYSLASGVLQLPKYIVDLRHSATHADLPPLVTLERAMYECLQWLKDKYWDIKVQSCRNTCDDMTSCLGETSLEAQSTDAQSADHQRDVISLEYPQQKRQRLSLDDEDSQDPLQVKWKFRKVTLPLSSHAPLGALHLGQKNLE
ncbi:hypothetical protein MIR68_009457 [Amoeboaphelidium protococcarum]|nr:hypothetical protein MIR68_009457 [Amoeboaphelidium protococcarum]